MCQNCVTYPPETLVKSVSYGDAPTSIDVAEVVDAEVRWWDLVCVSTRGRSRFQSVLLHVDGIPADIAPVRSPVSNRSLGNQQPSG